MSFMPLPPEDLVKKMVPILCRVIGVAFIVGGVVGMVLVPVFLFAKGKNALLFVLVFCGGSVLNLAVGFVLIKYMPTFMLPLFRKLRENPPF
jgi:hypothetical protein